MTAPFRDRFLHGLENNATAPERNLWCEVLCLAITDAINGCKAGIDSSTSPTARMSMIKATRRFLTTPNADFDEVCELAGLDPVAVRDRLRKLIAAAPAPEALAANAPRSRRYRTCEQKRKDSGQRRKPNPEAEAPGVGSDFAPVSGTGGGTAAQDGPELKHSGKSM